jgi:hypothetical protein
MIDPRTRDRLTHALILADRRATNRWALAHYCGALQRAEALMVSDGLTLRQALCTTFCGPLCARLVKVATGVPLTADERKAVR